jgi:hypothetical protein
MIVIVTMHGALAQVVQYLQFCDLDLCTSDIRQLGSGGVVMVSPVSWSITDALPGRLG